MESRNSIVDKAYRRAGLGNLSDAERVDLISDYDLIRDELLARRLWFFTVTEEKTGYTKTTVPNLFGFKFAYNIPSHINKVLGVNPRIDIDIIGASDEQLLTVGYARSSGDGLFPTQNRNAAFKQDGRILFTNVEIENTLVQVIPDESTFPSSFTLALTFFVAEFFAMVIAQNAQLTNKLRARAKEYLATAIQDQTAKVDPRQRAIFQWLKTYYQGLVF